MLGPVFVCVSGSVFSLLSTEDREKLKRASATAKQATSGQITSHTPEKPEASSTVKDSAMSSDVSFDGKSINPVLCLFYMVTSVAIGNKLYANDPAKRERYKAFMAGKAIQGKSWSVRVDIEIGTCTCTCS